MMIIMTIVGLVVQLGGMYVSIQDFVMAQKNNEITENHFACGSYEFSYNLSGPPIFSCLDTENSECIYPLTITNTSDFDRPGKLTDSKHIINVTIDDREIMQIPVPIASGSSGGVNVDLSSIYKSGLSGFNIQLSHGSGGTNCRTEMGEGIDVEYREYDIEHLKLWCIFSGPLDEYNCGDYFNYIGLSQYATSYSLLKHSFGGDTYVLCRDNVPSPIVDFLKNSLKKRFTHISGDVHIVYDEKEFLKKITYLTNCTPLGNDIYNRDGESNCDSKNTDFAAIFSDGSDHLLNKKHIGLWNIPENNFDCVFVLPDRS